MVCLRQQLQLFQVFLSQAGRVPLTPVTPPPAPTNANWRPRTLTWVQPQLQHGDHLSTEGWQFHWGICRPRKSAPDVQSVLLLVCNAEDA